jgi:hypothetical protein
MKQRMRKGEAEIPAMGPGAEIVEIKKLPLPPEKVREFMMVSKVTGGAGYLVVFLSFLFVYLAPGLVPLVLGMVGMILIGIAWYSLGNLDEDHLMKIFGIFVVGFVLFMTLSVAIAGVVTGHLVFLAPLGVLVLIIALLALQIKGCLARNLAISLLLLLMSGCLITAAGMYKAVSEVMSIGFWIWIISLLILFIVLAALEVRNLFVAGSRLGSWLFTCSGWLRLISYGMMLLMLIIWSFTLPLGALPPIFPFIALPVAGVVEWAILLLTAGSVALAAAAFSTARIGAE